MIKTMRRLAVAASGFALTFGLAAGSASANPVPFLYLVPTGPTTVPTPVPTGSSTYQLWVDPSGVVASGPGAPGNCANIVGAPACTGIYRIGTLAILVNGSLTMTGFSPNFASATSSHLISGTQLIIAGTGDGLNGNATPFDVGTLIIANSGTGPGDVILSRDPFGDPPGGGYLDTQFNNRFVPLPQTLGVAAIPEPSTALLLAAGIVGLAFRRGSARGASIG